MTGLGLGTSLSPRRGPVEEEEEEEEGGNGEGGDPHFDSVVFLASFDGADAATEFADESNSEHALTFNGSAQLDDAQSVLDYGASLLIPDVNGSFVSAPDSPDWQLSAANEDEFTIECRVRFSDTTSTVVRVLCGQFNADADQRSWRIFFQEAAGGGWNPKLFFQWSNAGTDFNNLETGNLSDVGNGAWAAIAVDKDSTGKMRIYVDGVMQASATPADSSLHDSTFTFRIGDDNRDLQLAGWVQEMRITKGVARYASDDGYEVAAEPFPRS